MINVKLAYRLLLSSHSIYCAARRVTAAAAGGERGRGRSPANGFRRGESPVAVAVAEDASFGRGLFLSMGRLSACSGESTFTHISESIMETWQSYLAFFKWASALLCAAYKHDHENCCENFAGMRDKGGASISFYPSHSLSRFGTISCWANMSDCDNVMSICYGNQLGILAPPHPSSPACRKSVIVQRWTNQERKLFFFQVSTFNEHGVPHRQPSQHEHHHPPHEHQLSPHIGLGGSHYLPGFLGLGRTQCGYRTSASAADQGKLASECSLELEMRNDSA